MLQGSLSVEHFFSSRLELLLPFCRGCAFLKESPLDCAVVRSIKNDLRRHFTTPEGCGSPITFPRSPPSSFFCAPLVRRCISFCGCWSWALLVWWFWWWRWVIGLVLVVVVVVVLLFTSRFLSLLLGAAPLCVMARRLLAQSQHFASSRPSKIYLSTCHPTALCLLSPLCVALLRPLASVAVVTYAFSIMLFVLYVANCLVRIVRQSTRQSP